MHVALPTAGFPIRRFPDQSLLTAPRNLSQSSTSFIGDIRQGIHCSALEYLFMHWFWLVVGLHQLLSAIIYIIASLFRACRQFLCHYHQKFKQIVKLPCSPRDHTHTSLGGALPCELELKNSVSRNITDCKGWNCCHFSNIALPLFVNAFGE